MPDKFISLNTSRLDETKIIAKTCLCIDSLEKD